jgi:hypothetical protein
MAAAAMRTKARAGGYEVSAQSWTPREVAKIPVENKSRSPPAVVVELQSDFSTTEGVTPRRGRCGRRAATLPRGLAAAATFAHVASTATPRLRLRLRADDSCRDRPALRDLRRKLGAVADAEFAVRTAEMRLDRLGAEK